MLKKIFLSGMFFFCLTFSGKAGNDNSTPLDYLAKDFYSDGKSLITSPFHWNHKSQLLALSFFATTGILLASDEETRDLFQRNRTGSTDGFSDLVRPLGGKRAAQFLGGLYVMGYLIKDRKTKETAYLGLKSLFFTNIFVSGLKSSFGRARPYLDNGAYDFRGPALNWSGDFQSIPSGHAATAFAVATVFAKQYPEWYVQYPAYTLAALVAWSRVNDDIHFASDVFVGAAIGYFITAKICNLNKNKSK